MSEPTTYRVIHSQKTPVSEEMEVLRPLPSMGFSHVGPFIMLDHFGPEEAPDGKTSLVPPHPHAGFQTVTYLLNGEGLHVDSLGKRQIIKPGDVNWMTAGKGIVHAEQLSGGDEGVMNGFQIWVNLPAKDKFVDPGFEGYEAMELPLVQLPGAGMMRIIAGTYQGVSSPVHTYSPLQLLHVRLEAGSQWDFEATDGFETAFYVAGGSAIASPGGPLKIGDMMLVDPQGPSIKFRPQEDTHVMILAGLPINEPVASHGPFVMNDLEQIRQAILDYQHGKMGTVEMPL
ncbi:pirin family protein [Pontibacter sp. G13]|uniref:pirin family protein n=1 Tax=Pontibacter sp. G13 TaxID=3074898 RepID=UPI0028896A78|nr:pirin family protein [Pontibacter sp. G13]WNJ16887.1 pirin family protein [Pontibacter sp. G13]